MLAVVNMTRCHYSAAESPVPHSGYGSMLHLLPLSQLSGSALTACRLARGLLLVAFVSASLILPAAAQQRKITNPLAREYVCWAPCQSPAAMISPNVAQPPCSTLAGSVANSQQHPRQHSSSYSTAPKLTRHPACAGVPAATPVLTCAFATTQSVLLNAWSQYVTPAAQA